MDKRKRVLALLLAAALFWGAMPQAAYAEGETACPHEYSATVTEPTCAQGGFTTWLCALCGHSYTAEETAPLEVCAVTAVAQTAPTCREAGVMAHYACAACGKLYLDEAATQQATAEQLQILPAACNLQFVEAVAATCGKEGAAEHWLCGVCGRKYADEAGTRELTEQELVLPRLSCHPEAVSGTDAACDSAGVAAHYRCPDCEKLYLDEAGTQPVESPEELVIPETGCQTESVSRVEPTCLAEGLEAHYRCVSCEKLYLDAAGAQPITDPEALVLPVAACVLEAVAQTDATCAAEGVAAHYQCKTCETLYLDEAGTQPVTDPAQLTLPVKTHTYGSWKVTVPAGVETAGEKTRICSGCGDAQTEAVPQLKSGLSTPKLSITRDSKSGKPVLSWAKVSKATAYQVYLVNTQTQEKTFLTQTASRKYTHTEAVVGEKYSFTVIAVSATRCSKASSVKSAVCKCAKPLVSVTAEPVSGKSLLSWQPVEGAVSYSIYRATGKNGTFKRIGSTQELSFLATSSAADKVYYYRVKAIGPGEDTNSSYSSKLSHRCDCPQPMVTAASGKTKGIKLSWAKVSGAKKYYVYRAAQEEGPYKRIATTTSRSYTDTSAPANKVSYYKVRGFGSAASLSAYSQPVSCMNHTFSSWKTITPNTPEGAGLKQRTCSVCGHVEEQITPKLKRSLSTPSVKIKQGSVSGKPYLSWAKVRNATAYQIYLVDGTTGEKTFLTETTSRSYSHSAAQVGSTYSFSVVAVNAKACSKYSSAKSILCICPTPTLKVSSEPVSGKPVLSWQAVAGAAEYQIYRATSKDGKYTLVAQTAELSARIDSAVANKTYYYRIRAVGEIPGTNSSLSSKLKQVCPCAQPQITVTYGSTKGLRISWKSVSKAKYYYIYRATQEEGPYTYIKKTTSLAYNDTAAPANKTVYYKVRACGTASSNSAYSQVQFAMNHTFGGWTVLRKSTPFEKGYRERTCSHCEFVQGQDLAVLPASLKKPALQVTSANSSGKPTLSWDKVSGAAEFWIYLYDSASDSYTFLTKTTSRSYIYQAEVGEMQSFAVMAMSETACSPFSAVKSATGRLPSTTLRITCDPQTKAQQLSWKPVEGAVGYGVYRSTVSISGFTLYEATDSCELTVTDETPGVQYYYKVQALHSVEEAASVMSNTAASRNVPGSLEIHAGRLTQKSNKVVWKSVDGAVKYSIYRSTSPTGSFKKVDTVKGNAYTETISSGKLYYYQVRAIDEEGNTVGKWSNIAAADETCQVPLKVYISPSCQIANRYAYGSTNEAKECRKIGKLVVAALERCGIAAMTNVTDDMDERMAQSNAWGADLHVPIHTNALYGKSMGTQIFYYGAGISKTSARAIMDVLAPLTPGSGSDSVRSKNNLYEIRHSNAPVAYVEVAFHDNKTEAKWIVKNHTKIAEAICKGICKTYGVTYVAP